MFTLSTYIHSGVNSLIPNSCPLVLAAQHSFLLSYSRKFMGTFSTWTYTAQLTLWSIIPIISASVTTLIYGIAFVRNLKRKPCGVYMWKLAPARVSYRYDISFWFHSLFTRRDEILFRFCRKGHFMAADMNVTSSWRLRMRYPFQAPGTPRQNECACSADFWFERESITNAPL